MERAEPRMTDLHVVLIEPEIPHNTGAIGRLCLATGSTLHLVGRLGFRLDDRTVRRAGLDYWEHLTIRRHDDFAQFRRHFDGPIFLYSARATRCYSDVEVPPRAALVFGGETNGLPPSLREGPDPCLTIPILDARVRSLNLATAVAIVLYDALSRRGWSIETAGEGRES